MDSWLIDRVFQPLADALARWTSCYGIAAFLFTGFTLLTPVARDAWEHDWPRVGVGMAMGVGLTLWAQHCDRQPAKDVLSPIRLRWQPSRILLLSLCPINLVLAAAASGLPDRLGAIGLLLFPAGVYFMACRKLPPRRQRERRPFFAFGRVAHADG